MTERDEARDADMVRRYKAGETLQAIATDYGISRERVRQLLARNGVRAADRPNVRLEAAIRHYVLGAGLGASARAAGVSGRTLAKALAERGYRRPSKRACCGTYLRYQAGCRCTACRKANTVYVHALKHRLHPEMKYYRPRGTVRHGTLTMYTRGCRCGACHEAGRAYRARKRTRGAA